jgi:3'5'-cyclic nucleotide phosphodiesterase
MFTVFMRQKIQLSSVQSSEHNASVCCMRLCACTDISALTEPMLCLTLYCTVVYLTLSSIGYDIVGLNNVYQVAAGTKLALRYNDASPLENHHAAMAWALLRRHDSDILTALTPTEKVNF